MKKDPTFEPDLDDELRPEYTFAYRKARPNRFAPAASDGSVVVILDPDVAEVFTSPEEVNNILRALIQNMLEKKAA